MTAAAQVVGPAGPRSPRIAVLYTPLLAPGGAERQALEELRWLREFGHEATLLTFELGDAGLFVGGADHAAVRVLGARSVPGRVVALRRVLREGFDVLVSHTSPELTWLATRGLELPYVLYHDDTLAYLYAGASSAPLRYRRFFRTKDAPELRDLGRRPGLSLAAECRALLKHRALRDAEAVLVLSEQARRELRAVHRVDATMVRACLAPELLQRVPGPAASRAELGLPAGPLVLSVCRLHPVKRLDLLIRAFVRVRATAPDALLVLVGDGPERDRLAALARSAGVAEAVRFCGPIPDGELWSYYAAADVFAAPTVADFNIAPYEALALGCRVVCAPNMEVEPEIDASGWLFRAPPGEEPLATTLVEALQATRPKPIDLSGMTWESRNRRVANLCIEVWSRRAGRPMATLVATHEGS